MSYGTNYSTKELQELLTEMIFVKTQGNEIQKNFDFTIPDYILDEIVLTKNKPEKLNLNILINIAVINNKLTNGQARMLKKRVLL